MTAATRTSLRAALALVLAAGSALADPIPRGADIKPPPEAVLKAPPIPPEHTAAMLAAYPPAARAAGIEGKATVECARLLHGAPDGCRIMSESPSGQGFGDAALALTRMVPRNPALGVVPQTKPVWRIEFAFKLKPPAIVPDVFGAVHPPPKWDKTVESDQILDAYPMLARASDTPGWVVLFCTVAPDGHMKDCIAKANPTRFGFEKAGLSLARYFVLHTTTDDGASTAGTTITIPILFAMP